MQPDRGATGDRRSWWFWPTIVVVIVAVLALVVWTLVQTGAVGANATADRPLTDPTTAIVTTTIT